MLESMMIACAPAVYPVCTRVGEKTLPRMEEPDGRPDPGSPRRAEPDPSPSFRTTGLQPVLATRPARFGRTAVADRVAAGELPVMAGWNGVLPKGDAVRARARKSAATSRHRHQSRCSRSSDPAHPSELPQPGALVVDGSQHGGCPSASAPHSEMKLTFLRPCVVMFAAQRGDRV
jgi:hypothetical protein